MTFILPGPTGIGLAQYHNWGRNSFYIASPSPVMIANSLQNSKCHVPVS